MNPPPDGIFRFPLFGGVHYYAASRGQGTPLVLLHGFTGSSRNWLPLTAAWEAHHKIITVDLLGHGWTISPDDPARYAIEQVAADLQTVIGSITPEPVHLLGYSMGGRLALYYALHYPVRSLILESASPGLATEEERRMRRESDEKLADEIEREGIAAFVERWEALPLFASQARLSDDVRAALRAQRLMNFPRGLANSLRGMGTGAQPPLWDSLPQVNVPTLLIAGAEDAKFVAIAQQMRDQIPNAQLAIIPDAGHTTHLEQPERFAETVQRFLALQPD
jgi:2-succinyl-6-hydroxy-2,4-cyclohexadiene-1-carboxylate synthase